MIIKNCHATVEDLTLKQAKMLGMVDLLDGNFVTRLEPTGLLAQALRALTSPVDESEHFPAEHLMNFVNVLIRDTTFIWKRCRPGTPLNNTLKALLDATDGWEAHPHGNTKTNPDLPLVKRRLQILYDKSLLDKESLEDTMKVSCRNCGTMSSGSMKCGRCKGAIYYSRACQKADWSLHKKICHKHNQFPAYPLATVVADWLRENLLAIVLEIQLVANRLGASRRDVVLEVDLKASNNPAILIKPLKVYIEGSAIPDWGSFLKAETLIVGLKDAHSLMTGQDILVLHRSYDADYEIVRFPFDFDALDALNRDLFST